MPAKKAKKVTGAKKDLDNVEERYSRQKDLVPGDKLLGIKATIIGTGAIGRQVALQLAAIGVPKIQLIDFDTVEVGNLAAQGFLEPDLGEPKVKAVNKLMHLINSKVVVEALNMRYMHGMDIGNVVFCCVDSMEIRQLIWEGCKGKVDLFVDGRMSAETMRIMVIPNTKEGIEYYPTTLFTDAEAFQGTCTAKTTIYSSNVVAGIMVAQLAKMLRGMPLDFDIQFNLLTNEITVTNKPEGK